MSNTALFLFHGELGDFLAPQQRTQTLTCHFQGNPGVKDPIETFGVPHSEVALIEVNGQTKSHSYQLQDNDHVEVYPLTGAQAHALLLSTDDARPRFIVDVNLGKLARWLRLLGFDTCWKNDFTDSEIVHLSVEERRVILTRDRRLLFHKVILQGFWIRSVIPMEQIQEILRRIGIADGIRPFHRCLECNGLIHPVAKTSIIDKLEPLTRKYYDEFFRCQQCNRIYWKGSHYLNLMQKLKQLKKVCEIINIRT